MFPFQMPQWLKISLLLCVFGYLKEIRPSEPFVYDFLIGPWRNITDEEVTAEVYPVGTYSNLILLAIVFLITDICRYKPLIVTLGVSGVIIWSLLLWTESLFALQVVEVFYGMFMSCEVAYYTYIYAKVDKQYFQQVTSHTRAAILAGRATSGLSSQLLVSYDVMDFRQLNYITFTSLCIATVWSLLLLPGVKTSIYFHSQSNQNGQENQEDPDKALQEIQGKMSFGQKARRALILMAEHFKNAYFNGYVLKWSIWWALSSCGYVQAENYMQPLYAAVMDSDEAAYNGAVECILTLLGSIAALVAGLLKVDWTRHGDVTLAVISLIQGILIGIASQTDNIFVCYTMYIVFGIFYHFMVTIASNQIAKNIDADSYGLIFGINTFLSLAFNSILTFAVATEGVGFHLKPRGQYVVYGGYHVAISLLFIIYFVGNLLSGGRTRKHSVTATSSQQPQSVNPDL